MRHRPARLPGRAAEGRARGLPRDQGQAHARRQGRGVVLANPRTIAKLESRIQERAALCLQFEVNDPRASFITVTRVKLSPDLSSGRIYYSVLGSEGDKSNAAHMLDSASGFLQRQIGRVLQMRRMPHLKWTYDDSMERADEIDKLIREARARDRTINPDVDAPETPA
ncbi:MAG: 30S ribosome-binding factor RbfA [Planctomycetota bacterium]